MKALILKLRRKLPRWMGGLRLSENDQAQAHIMGMALAALKSGETNARLICQQAETLRDMHTLMGKLLTHETILANYTLAANQAKAMLDEFPEGTIENEAMLLMASELFGLAANLQKLGNKKTESVGNPHD